MIRWLLAVAMCVPLAAAAQAVRSEEHSFRVVKVVEGLDHPWCVAFLPDGRMLITERPGRLRLVQDGKAGAPLKGLPEIAAHGQGGLFDIALHPAFEKNNLIYWSYNARGADGRTGTELARGRLAGDGVDNVEVLFRQDPKG